MTFLITIQSYQRITRLSMFNKIRNKVGGKTIYSSFILRLLDLLNVCGEDRTGFVIIKFCILFNNGVFFSVTFIYQFISSYSILYYSIFVCTGN